MSFQYRDSYVYAAGNDTDDALNFIEWLPTFQVCESKLRIFTVISFHLNIFEKFKNTNEIPLLIQ